MIEVGKQLKKQYFEKYVGKKVTILIERKTADGTFEGHTSNFIQVFAKGNGEEGAFAEVLLNDYSEEYMTGEIV